MNTMRVTANLNGLDELENAVVEARKAMDVLDSSISEIRQHLYKLGLTIDQPDQKTAG